MLRTPCSLSFGLLTFVAAVAAPAETGTSGDPHPVEWPSAVRDASSSAAFADFERLQRGKLHFDFGAVDYRLTRDGLNLNYRRGGVATRAVVGLSGDGRLELGWRLHRANLTFALDEQDNQSRYRIELAREF